LHFHSGSIYAEKYFGWPDKAGLTKEGVAMTKKIAFQIFLWGTVSSAVLFLWLTWDTHQQVAALSNADTLSAEVVDGKRVFEKYNCNDCHTILGFGGYYAPDLTKVVKRLGEDGISFRVTSPDEAFAASARKMPQQNLTEAEIEGLVTFLAWVGEIDNGDWPPQDSPDRLDRATLRLTSGTGLSPGAAVFQTKGCMNCHVIKGAGGKVGPALDSVGLSYSHAELKKYIRDPQSVDPSSKMPPQPQLSERELDEVAAFLVNLKEE
jgi:nitric oxide reductase subunit C